MRSPRIILIILLTALSVGVVAQADRQRDSLISSKISDLEAFWNKYKDVGSSPENFEPYTVIPGIFTVANTDTVSYADYLKKVNDAKIARLKRDLGLDLTTSYLENFQTAAADDNLVYRRRFQAGLDWNFLSGGYLSNHYKQRILQNESIIGALEPDHKSAGDNYITVSHKIIYSFNTHKIALLHQRQQIIYDKIRIANELYLLKHISRLDILDIMQQQVDVNSMSQVYKSYNDELKMKLNESAIPAGILPLFDIDVSSVLTLSDDKVADSIMKLKLENLSLQYNTWNDVKLNSQFRYNYYDMINPAIASRNFMSAGLGLSVPLPLNIKTNKDIVNAEAKLLKFEQDEAHSAAHTDLMNAYYDFRYKLKQYNNFYGKKKRYEELIRVESVKEKFGDLEFNPLTALNLLDELLSIKIELLDLQQEMYLQLLDISSKVIGAGPAAIVRPYIPDNDAVMTEKTERSIYIWSASRAGYTASYITEYLRLNNISTAIISVRNNKQDQENAAELVNALHSSGIGSELLIGSNKLLYDKDPEAVFDSLLAGFSSKSFAAIHLDVEPQALEGWDSGKEKMLQQYVVLLKKTREYCDRKGLSLSVSIPVFYPENILKEIYSLADHVYVMAYEHPDADFIARKLKEEMEAGAQKTIIALSAKDFENRNDFEMLVSRVSEMLHTSRFAMHDLEKFIRLDEASIEPGK